MDKQPTKFNITRDFLQKAKTKLEAFFHFAMPEEQFRFVTFERDDYAEHKLTMLLFDFAPDRVYVTVPHDCNLDAAVEDVKQLNPQLQLEKVPLSYFDESDLVRGRQTQELRIIYATMAVNAEGELC